MAKANAGSTGVLRLMGGIVAAGLAFGIAAPAQANIVQNGGFETGAFAPEWTQIGNTGFSGVTCASFGGVLPTEGNCQAFFGPVGSPGGISQTFGGGEAGIHYTLEFDLATFGGTPNSYDVSFGGVSLTSGTDAGAFGYTHLTFSGLTNAASQTLAFTFRQDPSYYLLDNVSITIPEPATVGLLGAGLVGMFFSRRRKAA